MIYAIQHQSIWETIVLANLLPGPISIVMKKELISIPFIGWLFKHAGAIPLDRGKQVQSIRRLLYKLTNIESSFGFNFKSSYFMINLGTVL